MNKIRPIGLLIIAILLILTSSAQLTIELSRVKLYMAQLYPLPLSLIVLRYFITVMLRMVGLACGIGVLFFSNVFRKLLILLCSLTIVTIYWKHPFFIFEKMYWQAQAMYFNAQIPEPANLWIRPWIAWLMVCLIDVIFAGIIIFYFTRPKVKELFTARKDRIA